LARYRHARLGHRVLAPCVAVLQVTHALARARHRGATPTPCASKPKAQRSTGLGPNCLRLATGILASTVGASHRASTHHGPPLHRHMHSTSMPCPRHAQADPRHTQARGSPPTVVSLRCPQSLPWPPRPHTIRGCATRCPCDLKGVATERHAHTHTVHTQLRGTPENGARSRCPLLDHLHPR
jgi:hypothetical protein